MPELGQAARYNLPQSRLSIPRVSFPDPPRLPIPQEEAIKAAGELRGAQIFASAEEKSAAARAQLIANIGNMLATLPQKVEESYWKGRQNKLRSQGLDLQGQLLTGDLSGVSRLPPGTKLGPDGSVSYSPEDPFDKALKRDYLRARINRIDNPASAIKPNTFDLLQQDFNAPLGAVGRSESSAPASSVDYLDWIKEMEGYSPEAYSDSGQTSIGYGTRGAPGEKIDEIEAERRLATELTEHEARVATMAAKHGVALTQPQKEALTSFDFNTGAVNRIFETATVNGVLDPALATAKMAEYRHADARAKDGILENRRKAEIARFSQAGARPTEELLFEPIEGGGGDLNLTPIGSEPIIVNQGAASALPAPPLANVAAPALAAQTEAVPVRRATLGRDPVTGAMLYSPTPEKMVSVLPGGKAVDISPRASDTGISQKMDEKLALEGYDVANMTLEQKQEALRGTDIRGRTKLTDNQKNSLQAAAKATGLLTAIEKDFSNLEKQGLVGVLSPKRGVEKFIKKPFGKAGYDFTNFNAKVKSNLFTLARSLQGAGVLTEKDIERMEQLSPTGDMERPQFMGNLDAVKDVMIGQLKTWKAVNLSALSEGQIEMVDEVMATLTGGTVTAPAVAAPVKPSPKAGDVVGKFRFKGGNPAERSNWEPIP